MSYCNPKIIHSFDKYRLIERRRPDSSLQAMEFYTLEETDGKDAMEQPVWRTACNLDTQDRHVKHLLCEMAKLVRLGPGIKVKE